MKNVEVIESPFCSLRSGTLPSELPPLVYQYGAAQVYATDGGVLNVDTAGDDADRGDRDSD